jgi:hypothetical protein
MESVKPGLNIKIVIDIDVTKEMIHVRGSSLYDITGNTLIIAQTSPPVGPSLFNKPIMITYLKKEDHKFVRYGFPARLAEVVDYDLSGGRKVKALIAEREGDTFPYSIRMFYRIEPSAESGLRLFIGGSEMKILDISLGGIRFCCDGYLKLGPEGIEEISLDVGNKSYSIKARISRTQEDSSMRSWKGGSFATAEFLAAPEHFERILVKRLHQIERDSRAKKIIFQED